MRATLEWRRFEYARASCGAPFFLRLATTLNVTPAKAGAYPEISGHRPAFAGMTGLGD